ncbi:MAG: protein translocase subunit SecD [Gammaproteobacteria bacterium]|nr:protein translocase subunit SecD [Gammaproteobacteria bacterium]
MINQYPLWKYLLLLVVVVLGSLYSLPNIYGEDPSVQVSHRTAAVDNDTQRKIEAALSAKQLTAMSYAIDQGRMLVRFNSEDDQLKATDIIKSTLSRDHIIALNLAPATPAWLTALGAKPMYLGLDLRGGVHFLMEVDMEAAITRQIDDLTAETRSFLRSEKVRYLGITQASNAMSIKFRNQDDRSKAISVMEKEFDGLRYEEIDKDGIFLISHLTEKAIRDEEKAALQQNITTLRNRVNELGVAEPVIQQQGTNRIVVQLPGVQDTARAKEILGATATLEFRLTEGTYSDWSTAQSTGRAPLGSRLYHERNGDPVLLKRRVIVTGDQINDAASTIDQQSGSPAVSIRLDGKGAKKMGDTTRDHIGDPMAVVFIENKIDTKVVDGQTIKTRRKIEEVINIATIRGAFSKNFQITGLNSTEARDLALLLRAGALRAPVEIIEERTVGPSLGQDNINSGFYSVVLGFVAVLIFMLIYYKLFGIVANLALTFNLVLIFAVLSMLQATLTLPGIAGIVLTVGMAVDANVLIFERIREEIRNGNSPQASIHAGYAKALSTITDANITTLLAAVVLFSFGTGPIKGFAITLSIGILTSMFTAILGTRAIVNLIYGSRNISKISI